MHIRPLEIEKKSILIRVFSRYINKNLEVEKKYVAQLHYILPL